MDHKSFHHAIPGFLVLVFTVAGCAKSTAPSPKPAPIDPSLLSPQINRYRAPTTNPSTLIHAGTLPIAYIFDTGGNIRIVDANTRAIVARATVPPGAIISIDPDTGILIAQQRLTRSPLPADHRYEIWWDSRK